MLEVWSTLQAAQLVGVPYRTVRRWLNEGLVCLRLHPIPCRSERLRLVQADVEELWAIASLRQQGVSLQHIKRVLVRLAGMRLSDFKAVLVEPNGDVIGIREGEDASPAWERLCDGQRMIPLDALRDALRAHPGEQMGDVWELLLHTAEAPIV